MNYRLLLPLLLLTQAAFAGPVTLRHEGTVKDALKAIAAQAGVNLIVIGELKEPMEVQLTDASAEEALSTVAAAAQLHVERSGTIWTVRAMSDEEKKNPLSPAPVELPSETAAQNEDTLEDARDEAKALEAQKLALAKEQAKVEKRLRRQFKGKGSDDDVVKTGGALTVAEGQSVGNAVAYGGPVTVEGHVDGDVVAFGGSVRLGAKATVTGDVVAFGGDIRKEPGAVVGGEEVSFGGSTTGVLAKEIVKARQQAQARVHDADERGGVFAGIGSFFARFAVLFALGFLFTLFAPSRMKALESEIKAAPGKSLLTGVLGSFALLPLTVLLAVTVIGIPFIPAMWIMALLGVTMGFAAFAADLGMKLPMFRGKKTQALVLAVGLLGLLVIGMIPVLGPTALLGVAFISFGAIIRTRFGSVRRMQPGIPVSEIPA